MKRPTKFEVLRKNIQLEKLGRMKIFPGCGNFGFTCLLHDITQLGMVKEMGLKFSG